jgi:hypothetical protein
MPGFFVILGVNGLRRDNGMGRKVKVINVDYNAAGKPDKKSIGWQIITWLRRGYALARRDEITGGQRTQDYTLLTFVKEN